MAIVGMGVSGLLLVGSDPDYVKSQAGVITAGDGRDFVCSCECRTENDEPLCSVNEGRACTVGHIYTFVTDKTSCGDLKGNACTPDEGGESGSLASCQVLEG